MPIPKKRPQENEDAFVSRCMTDATMKQEYPLREQRLAVCINQLRKG
jgi:hypothetical protein